MAANQAARHARRGVAAVEFALVFVLAMGSLLLMIEIGWQAITEMALQNGAADATRFAMTGQSEVPDESASPSCRAASILWIAVHVAPNILLPSRLTVTSSVNGATPTGSSDSGFGGTKSQTVLYVFTYKQPYLTILGPAIMGQKALVHTVAMLAQNEPYTSSGC